ncbi:MAG: hypothetical protein MUE71_06480, partial [Chitinophagaceae bacterium]|nr:hypothetical protein [Chitinophagaceae bacterium]
MEERKILVTGIGGNVGQGIIRNIRNAFPDIYIVGTNTVAFSAGNFLCNQTYTVPFAYHEDYIDTINQIISREGIHLIIPSTDYEVYHLSKNAGILKATVAASSADTAQIYLDKYLSFLHHQEHHIPFAQSWLPENFDYSAKEIIAKPREGRGSRGIFLNPENLSQFGKDYMIQPLYKGIELTTAAYVNKAGDLHGIFTMERELSSGTTVKSKVVFEYDHLILPIIEKMIMHAEFKGSFNLQSILTQEEGIIPFEVNCRISGTNSIRHNLGFKDVVYTVQEYL